MTVLLQGRGQASNSDEVTRSGRPKGADIIGVKSEEAFLTYPIGFSSGDGAGLEDGQSMQNPFEKGFSG